MEDDTYKFSKKSSGFCEEANAQGEYDLQVAFTNNAHEKLYFTDEELTNLEKDKAHAYEEHSITPDQLKKARDYVDTPVI